MGSEERKILMNRIVSAVAGGLVVFAVMNMTVLDASKKRNAELAAMLDDSRYQASRLYADAKEQLDSRQYEKAKASLEMLFAKQPGSMETAQGRELLAVVESTEKMVNAKWEAAVVDIKKKWSDNRTAELRGEAEKARIQMEKDLTDKIGREWESESTKLKDAWVKELKL